MPLRIILTLLFLLPLYVIAQPEVKPQPILKERLTLTHMQYDPKLKIYRISSVEKAATLMATKEFAQCLQQSVKKKKMVEVSFEAYKLNITACQVLP